MILKFDPSSYVFTVLYQESTLRLKSLDYFLNFRRSTEKHFQLVVFS